MNQTDKIISVRFNKCQHNKFIIDESLDRVKCGICGDYLSPMWVIKYYSLAENRLFNQIHALQTIAEKAEAKNRCKCEKCGQITRIQK